MKPEILLMAQLFSTTMESLEDNYNVHRYWEAKDPEALLAEISDRIKAVVTDGGRGVEESVLSKLPKVEVVTVFGVGVDAVALPYCKANSIKVTNTPDVLSDDVADLGVALMLGISRQVVFADNYCRQGHWSSKGAMPLTTRMTGKRAGIFGMGSIGIRLARRLEAFDMTVSYCNRNKRSDANYRYEPNLQDLAAEVDYLIIAASASPSTQNIVNQDILSALGPDGFLVNISRGSLVDEPALIAALQNGSIKGAALDVFAEEPSIPDALIGMDNVILQPHQASATFDTRKAMGQVVCENLEQFFSDRPLKTEYFIRN